MHAMSFTLVSEQAGRGGEARISTRFNLAAVWPKVRVDEFAVEKKRSVCTVVVVAFAMAVRNVLDQAFLTHSCTSAFQACGGTP